MAPPGTLRVTVVIPTYNAARFIDATIASVLRQTADCFEAIVVDDGSIDDTISRVAAFHDPRIHVVEQSHESSTVAMNSGVRLARGEYIALLDHDDLWHETKLSRHLDILDQHPELDITFDWHRFIDEDGRDTGRDKVRRRGVISFAELLSASPVVGTSTLVLRRSAMERVGGFDQRFCCAADLHLVLRIARLRPANVYCIPEELTSYRQHRGQQSRDWRSMEREWFVTLEELRRSAPEITPALASRATSPRRRFYAVQAYKSGEFGTACNLAAQALRDAPGFFLSDLWSWQVSAACLAGLLLPAGLHRKLQRVVGIRE